MVRICHSPVTSVGITPLYKIRANVENRNRAGESAAARTANQKSVNMYIGQISNARDPQKLRRSPDLEVIQDI
jgi:hypothetical protein